MAGIVRSRLPWLAVNLVTETVAVSAIAIFQDEIAKIVALAVLLPDHLLAGQRMPAYRRSPWRCARWRRREMNAANTWRVIWREVLAACCNGLALSAIMAVAVIGFYHDWKLALTAAMALMADIIIAAIIGILAPLVLEKLGRDPAVSSPIIVTFVTDFVGFFALLAIAALVLL